MLPTKQERYTLQDVEEIAKSDPKSVVQGRINHLISNLESSYQIPFSKIQIQGPKNTPVYAFTEDEAYLTVIFVRVKSKRPHSHGRKDKNIHLEHLYNYHLEFLRQIGLLPEHLRAEVEQDERFQISSAIHQSLGNIHAQIDELEKLFYLSPPAVGLDMLKKVEAFLSDTVEEMWESLADSLRQQATVEITRQNPTPSEESVKGRVKEILEVKLSEMSKRLDPDVHFLDHLVADHLRRRIVQRTRTVRKVTGARLTQK